MENQSTEGYRGVSSEQPVSDLPNEALPNDELNGKYTDGLDEPGQHVWVKNPNRNANGKPDIDKLAYS